MLQPLARTVSTSSGRRPNPRPRPTSRSPARSVFDACGFKRLNDDSASHVAEHVAGLRADAPPSANRKRRQSLSLQTLNFCITACKQFYWYLVKDRRVPDSLLSHLQTFNIKLDGRHDRRALQMDEIAWLLETTRESGSVYRGLTGWDRFAHCATTVQTCLRALDLASLTAGSFQLQHHPPVARLLACYAKNQTEVDQPLPAGLIGVLRACLVESPSNRRVWGGTWTERSALMFRKDLEAARNAWLDEAGAGAAERTRREASSFLVYRDEAGLVADCHALRHTFITMPAISGVSPKMAQSLARHSDINLTMSRYTHVGLHDQAAALETLPPLKDGRREREKPAG